MLKSRTDVIRGEPVIADDARAACAIANRPRRRRGPSRARTPLLLMGHAPLGMIQSIAAIPNADVPR